MWNPLIEVFFNQSNLLLWNSLFNLSRNEAVCGACLLTNLFHSFLQFPSKKSSLFAAFTNLNAIFPTEELVFMERILSSHASSFNSRNLTIFHQGRYLPPLHPCVHPEKKTHYLPIAFYNPSAFHMKEIFLTNCPNQFFAWKLNNMNIFFFVWHFLKS